MGIPISQLPELTSADVGDLIPIVDASGNVTKRVAPEGLAPVIAENLPAGSVGAGAIGGAENLGSANADTLINRVIHGYIINGTNIPTPLGYFTNIPHPTQGSLYNRQHLFHYSNNKEWTRYQNNGTWSAWELTKVQKSVDANGWTVYDHGTYKEYKKRLAGSYSIPAGSGQSISIGSLPVGVTLSATSYFAEISGPNVTNREVYIINDIVDGSGFNLQARSTYTGGSLSGTYSITLTITEK